MAQISVQMVTYNSAITLQAALTAVLAQTGVTFDLVVVDNASTDASVARARELGVRVIELPTNQGYTGGHNAALKEHHSPYVLTLNPDVILQPDFLRNAVHALDQNDKIGSLAGALLRVDALDAPPYAIDATGVTMSRSRRQRLLNDNAPLATLPQHAQAIFGPDGAAAVYRRAMLDDIAVEGEIFDEDFFMHKEDIDICWRAQLYGWQSFYEPTMVGHHVRHFRPNQRERVSPFMRFLGVRNRYLLMLKNDLPRLLLPHLPYTATYDMGILGYILVKEHASLKAYGSLAKLSRRMLYKRKIIQAKRRVSWHEMQKWFQ